MTTPFRGELALAALVGAFGLPGALAAPSAVYVAKLQPMNSNVAGHEATGKATFAVEGDQLTINVEARGLPPNMMHLAHFHGFTDNRQATCAPASADKNRDGVIDLIETEPYSGTTMVPFNADPAALHIVSDTYPKASADGAWTYHKTVSLKALDAAFAKTYHDQKLDLDRRVVYLHGVPPSTKLPATAKSLGDIPTQVTLPIACGEIRLESK